MKYACLSMYLAENFILVSSKPKLSTEPLHVECPSTLGKSRIVYITLLWNNRVTFIWSCSHICIR